MVNIFKYSKYVFYVILIISVIWIVHKKTESMKTLKRGETRNNEISGFDKVMFELTGIMEKIKPSSPFTNEMKKQKQTLLNHL